MIEKGILYLIPTPISESTEVYDVVPQANRAVIDRLDYFIVENLRSARRFLSKAGAKGRIDDMEFVELSEHTMAGEAVERMVEPLLAGRSAGVLSEAGVPGEACHRRGIRVVPLVGPSSIIMAMMASGLNGQSFAFNGYLPIKPAERSKALRTLERRATMEHQSQIFIEAPYRTVKLMEQILEVCQPATRLTVACDITSADEIIVTREIKQWRASKIPDIAKRPTIFIIG